MSLAILSGTCGTKFTESISGSSFGDDRAEPDKQHGKRQSAGVMEAGMIHSADPSCRLVEKRRVLRTAEEGTLRVFYQPNTTHSDGFYLSHSNSPVHKLFCSLIMPADVPASNQLLYLLKEVFNPLLSSRCSLCFCLWRIWCCAQVHLSAERRRRWEAVRRIEKDFIWDWGSGSIFLCRALSRTGLTPPPSVSWGPSPMPTYSPE